MKRPHIPKLKRTAWMSLGGVSIIAFAGLTAYYIDARQKTEVSSQLAAQQATNLKELRELEAKQAKIEEKKAAEKKAADEKAERAEAAKAQASTATTGSATSVATESISTVHRSAGSIDVIVNKKHPLIPLGFIPTITSAPCASYGSASVSSAATSDFSALCTAAKAANVPLAVSSSYRSYAEQVSTYNYWVSVSGKAGADTYSARPGYSEHQTGLSVDFMVPGGARLSDFTGTAQQKWLAANAWKYGFIQRYTSANTATTGYTAESWHYRYIGRSAAKDYTTQGIGSLEQYWGVSGGNY